MSAGAKLAPTRDGDAPTSSGSHPSVLPSDWIGESPIRTPGNDEQASSATRAGDGNRQRPKKPGPSLL